MRTNELEKCNINADDLPFVQSCQVLEMKFSVTRTEKVKEKVELKLKVCDSNNSLGSTY